METGNLDSLGPECGSNGKSLSATGRMRTFTGKWARGCALPVPGKMLNNLRVARFGDNMRNVAVTEGNKVNAQIDLGYTVNGYGVGDLVHSIEQVTAAEVNKLTTDYEATYVIAESLRKGGSQSSVFA